MPDKRTISSLSACALFASLLASGCASSTPAIEFGRSELQLIPGSSLQRIASAHAADETVAVRVEGRDEAVEVKEFKDREYATVYAAEGKEENIRFADLTALSIFRKPPADGADGQKDPSARAAAATAVEAVAFAPIVPVAIGTWPLLRAMGLDAAKNSEDNAKAGLIYRGMSKKELLESVGKPRETYACLLKLHLKDQPDVPLEIWVYDDDKVLRGGRTLSIDLGTGTVSHNSYNTEYFKDSSSFSCSPMAVP